MKTKKDILDSLDRIEEYCEVIEDYVEKNNIKEWSELRDHEYHKFLITMALAQIGEEVKLLPDDLKLKYSETKWGEIVGLRNRVVHEFIWLNYFIIYGVVKTNVPELLECCDIIISDLKTNKDTPTSIVEW